MVVNGTQVKVYAWYDNEWGYACRLADIARMVGGSLVTGRRAASARLCRRHRGLLGLHADRRRAADAGAAALQHARLHADPARLAVPALRTRRDRHEPRRGLARRALRAGGDALRRARLQIGALVALAQLDPGWGVGAFGRLRDGGAGRLGRGEGPRQDVLQIGGEAPRADRATAGCSAGSRR